MNKKTRKKLSREKKIWAYNLAKRKKAEREIANLEHEIKKIQNTQDQIVNPKSEKELQRIELSKEQKESKEII
jgi:hypothetical protein